MLIFFFFFFSLHWQHFFLFPLPFSPTVSCPFLFPTEFFVLLSQLPSPCVFFSLSAQVCCRGTEQERGALQLYTPQSSPSPGVGMTGSQPDGTEQVCSMWPPLLRGRMGGGEGGRGGQWGGGFRREERGVEGSEGRSGRGSAIKERRGRDVKSRSRLSLPYFSVSLLLRVWFTVSR